MKFGLELSNIIISDVISENLFCDLNYAYGSNFTLQFVFDTNYFSQGNDAIVTSDDVIFLMFLSCF